MEDFIHVHSEKERPIYTLLLLIIPIIIFVGYTIFLNIKIDKSKQAAASTEVQSVVLGESTENIK